MFKQASYYISTLPRTQKSSIQMHVKHQEERMGIVHNENGENSAQVVNKAKRQTNL